jgi:hypothetical protein
MTPWEPSKIPFLVGFAGILTARYKDLAETYWGFRELATSCLCWLVARCHSFPSSKDFGQMLIFSGAYALYLIAVRRYPVASIRWLSDA